MSNNEKFSQKGKADPADNSAKLSEKLGTFIVNHRKVLLIIAVLFLVSLLGFGIYTIIDNKAGEKATEALEALEASYAAIDSASDNTSDLEKNVKLAAVILDADSIINKQRGNYPAIRAMVIKAESLYASGDPAAAEKTYALIEEKFPRSHLALVSLFNAAVIAEDRNELETALAYLLKAEKKYPDSATIDRIRIEIGRAHV